tara:strand:+ start:96 stop:407 length:312 start_codon:yes stop_codon:yes gene_type:complete
MYKERGMKIAKIITIFSLLLGGCTLKAHPETVRHQAPRGTSNLVYYKGINNPNFYRLGIDLETDQGCQQGASGIIHPIDIILQDETGTKKQILLRPSINLSNN